MLSSSLIDAFKPTLSGHFLSFFREGYSPHKCNILKTLSDKIGGVGFGK